jgi:hypothetical protein
VEAEGTELGLDPSGVGWDEGKTKSEVGQAGRGKGAPWVSLVLHPERATDRLPQPGWCTPRLGVCFWGGKMQNGVPSYSVQAPPQSSRVCQSLALW